jgi:hypothetical protein
MYECESFSSELRTGIVPVFIHTTRCFSVVSSCPLIKSRVLGVSRLHSRKIIGKGVPASSRPCTHWMLPELQRFVPSTCFLKAHEFTCTQAFSQERYYVFDIFQESSHPNQFLGIQATSGNARTSARFAERLGISPTEQ